MSTSYQAAAAASSDRARSQSDSFLGRLTVLVYGAVVYAAFLGVFLYLIAFIAGAFVPKHIDSGPVGSVAAAMLVNGGFLALFAVQHMIMARDGFKERWTKIIPPAAERSTFVLTTIAILSAMVWFWQPIPDVVWHVEGPAAIALWSLSALGWATVLVATFLIDHFELFGISQAIRHFRGLGPKPVKFQERSLYRFVRHPLMTGFLLAFWCTPHMTQGHLFFAAMCTGYILVGTKIEERTLVAHLGDSYRDYMRRVPGMIPMPRLRKVAE